MGKRPWEEGDKGEPGEQTLGAPKRLFLQRWGTEPDWTLNLGKGGDSWTGQGGPQRQKGHWQGNQLRDSGLTFPMEAADAKPNEKKEKKKKKKVAGNPATHAAKAETRSHWGGQPLVLNVLK